MFISYEIPILVGGVRAGLGAGAGEHDLVSFCVFAHGKVGWFAVFGLGFFFAFAAVGYDFGCAGDYIGDLEGDASPGLFALAAAVDGDESACYLEFGDVGILVGDFCCKGVLVEDGGA